MNTFRIILVLLTVSFFGNDLFSQSAILDLPRKSPQAKVMQRIGLTDITISYHRPAAKDRKIWGEVVPLDGRQNMPWRAGANENTTITFSTDVEIEGQPLAAGSYGLHMIPTENEVTVIFNKDYQSWGSFSYNPEQDALRIKTTYHKAPFHELLTYSFTDLTSTSAICQLTWADRSIPFEISTDKEEVIASIREQLRTEPGWGWQGWYEAADYCFRAETNYKQGLEWASRSIWAQPNMYNIRVKARLMAKQKGLEGEEFHAFLVKQMEEDMGTEPVDWKAWNDGAKFILKDYGDAETAMRWADRSMQQYKTFDNTNVKAQALQAMGEDKQADKLIDKMLANGSNRDLNKYGYQLLFSGKGKEALKIFHANAENHPDDPNVWDSLGEAYFNLGDYENANKYFKKCLDMDPDPFLKTHAGSLLKQSEQKLSQ